MPSYKLASRVRKKRAVRGYNFSKRIASGRVRSVKASHRRNNKRLIKSGKRIRKRRF